MKYFLLETDPKCVFSPQITGSFFEMNKRDINLENIHKIKKRTLLHVKSNTRTIFTDVITHPFLLFSADAFDTIKKYEMNIPNRQVVLLDAENRQTSVYFLPVLEKVACLPAENSLTEAKHKPDELVFMIEPIKDKAIFWIDGFDSTKPVINLDLAESLLRRGARGLHFTEITVR